MKQEVVCYGKNYSFDTVDKAIMFFMDCYNGCDPVSSEAQRYSLIIARLFDNKQTGKMVKVSDMEE